MSNQLQSISPNCGKNNIGGVKLLEYLNIKDILKFPEFINDNNTITSPVILQGGTSWLNAEILPNETRYRERQRGTNQNPFYNQRLTGIIPKDEATNSNQILIMKDYRFIIRYTNMNDEVKLLGSPEYPFKFKGDLDSGSAPGKFSGHKFEFFSENPKKAPFFLLP